MSNAMKRLVSLLLCLLLAAALLPSAAAEDDWRSLSITLAWEDQAAFAFPVEGELPVFWAVFPAGVPAEAVITLEHPDGTLTFSPESGSQLQLVESQNVETGTPIMIQVFRDGQGIASCRLYVSTHELAVEPETYEEPYEEPQPEEEPYAEPEADEEPYAEPQAEEQPAEEPEAYVEPYVEPETDEESYAEPQAEEQPAEEPEADAEPYVEPEAEEELYAEPQAEEQPAEEPEAYVEPYVEPETDEEPYAEAQSEEQPAEEPEAYVEPYFEPESDEEPYAEPQAEEQPAEEPEAYAEPYVEPEADEEPYAEPETEEEPQTEPAAPSKVAVPVQFVDINGKLLRSAQLNVEVGATTSYTLDPAYIPDHYDLVSADTVLITVDDAGNISPDVVTFRFSVAATPTPVPVIETPIPAGEPINRYGVTNTNSVNIRAKTSTKAKAVASKVKKGSYIWLLQEITGEDGDSWYHVYYNGKEGWIVSKFVDVMTQADSEEYAESAGTPVPESMYELRAQAAVPTIVPTNTPTMPPVVPETDADEDTDEAAPGDDEFAAAQYDEEDLAYPEDEEDLAAPEDEEDLAAPEDEEAAAETAPPAVTSAPVSIPGDPVAVPVYYVDETNAILRTAHVRVTPGSTLNIDYPEGTAPEGYELTGARSVSVTVSESGVASPEALFFHFHKTDVPADPYKEETGDEPEETAAPEITAAPETPVPETDREDSGVLDRYGRTNKGQVNVRNAATTSGSKVQVKLKNKNTVVWLVREIMNEDDELWTEIIYKGKTGYVMSQYITPMTLEESQAYAAKQSGTPVPTTVPEETEEPEAPETEAPEPTEAAAEPTQETLVTPPAQEEVTEPEPYSGYALTLDRLILRSEPSTSDSSSVKILPVDTLLTVTSQTEDWHFVETLDGDTGYVQDVSIRKINPQEAEYYIRQWNNAHPTATPAPTAEPVQMVGYAQAIGNNVFFRELPTSLSDIRDILNLGDVVRVTGQVYMDGEAWHVAVYDNGWGYVRADMMRMMDEAEVYAWQQAQSAAQQAAIADDPDTMPMDYNVDNLSSYGYVESTSVNFRAAATSDAKRISVLRQYAFCLVLGTEVNNGEEWYHILYNGVEGYVSAKYFKQMTIAELEAFLDSSLYTQGIANNTKANMTPTPAPAVTIRPSASTGTSSGNKSSTLSAENDTWNTWLSNGVTYAPFQPFATVGPATTAVPQATPNGELSLNTYEPLATNTAQISYSTETTEPVDQPTETEAPVYPVKEEKSSALPFILIGIGLLVLGGGGFYLYRLHRKNQRRLAVQRAEARRNADLRTRSAEGRPYPRTPGTPQGTPRPGAGTAQVRTPRVQQPSASQPTGSTPYSGRYPGNPASGSAPASHTTYPRPERPAQQTPPAAPTSEQPGSAPRRRRPSN